MFGRMNAQSLLGPGPSQQQQQPFPYHPNHQQHHFNNNNHHHQHQHSNYQAPQSHTNNFQQPLIMLTNGNSNNQMQRMNDFNKRNYHILFTKIDYNASKSLYCFLRALPKQLFQSTTTDSIQSIHVKWRSISKQSKYVRKGFIVRHTIINATTIA